jgi:hypothetical protein
MNNLAILPELVMNLLQNQNVKIQSVENLLDTAKKEQEHKSVKENDNSIGTTNIEDLADKDEKILKNEKIENNKVKTT